MVFQLQIKRIRLMTKLTFSIMLLIVGFAKAQDTDTFEKANQAYGSEKYQEAIDGYTSILDKGKESPALYFNLANAYYKLSNIAPSIYYYEKALELAPSDADVKNNLKYAQNATIDAIDVIPEGVISRTVNKVTNSFTFNTWAWISVLGVVIFVILFLFYYFSDFTVKKRLFFITSGVSMVIAVLGLFFAFRQYNFVQNNKYAIVFAKETVVKSEPNLRSEATFELHEGTKLRVIDAVNDWKKIRLADGKIGWISSTDIKEL